MAKAKNPRQLEFTVIERSEQKSAKKAAKRAKREAKAEARALARALANAPDAHVRAFRALEHDATLEAFEARRIGKRALKSDKRQAKRIALQAETIALRVSMGLEWLIVVKFVGGARDIRIVGVDAIPKGYQESRACRKTRGDAPGLRYIAAERVRDNIIRKMGLSQAQRRKA